MNPIRTAWLLASLTLVSGVSAEEREDAPPALDHDHDHDHDAAPGIDHGLVALTPGEREEFGIEVAAAGEGTIRVTVSLPGEVRPDDDHLAHIVPRYSGIVIEVRAGIGDRVSRGDVLAVVESDDALAPYELKTLIDGTVIAKHITRGEAVSRDKDTYVIADLGSVWVDLTVYQRELDRIRVGQTASIFTGHGPADAEGAISYVTPVVDERTRTATARVVLPNPRGRWRPGMFITAAVLVEERRVAVAVPSTAIHIVDERPVVFVETPDGFLAREVTPGTAGIRWVEIVSGLETGERYVAEGGFLLKAELGKDSFGHGHAH